MDMDNDILRSEYIARINRVINYINDNLDENLTLDLLSEIAAFSKYHFHRIFKAMVGETLNEFISRIRLEKSAVLLRGNPRHSITQIAFDCGFSSPSAFSRAFKKHFGITPSDFRKEKHSDSNTGKTKSNISKEESNLGKDISPSSSYNMGDVTFEVTDSDEWRLINMDVEVRELPEYRVAYIRFIGKYGDKGISEAWGRIEKWAKSRDLIGEETLLIGISHDDPDITPSDKCRYDACITVPDDVSAEGEVGIQMVPSGKYAVYHCEGFVKEIGEAFDDLFCKWLPGSGYQPDARPCFEIYTEECKPGEKWQMDICIPVKPL